MKKKIIVIILILFILVFLILFIYKKNNILKDSVLTINKVVNKPINFIDKKIKENKEKNKIYKKYKKLNKKYKKIDLMDAKYEESQKEINDLKKVLKLNNVLSESEYLNSTVLFRDIGYWYNNITIDRGTSSDIKKGMAVITDDGLIGVISSTSSLTSVVKLLTTNEVNNKISVKIKVGEDDYVYGLIAGYDKKSKCLKIENISDNKKIPKGSLVTTTGFGSNIPSGILVGRVNRIIKDNFDLSNTLLVKSSVNFNNINYVTIIKKEVTK